MQKRVSLKDIANKVGVSIALVSYVINGQEKEKRVSAEVVKKIRQAAEELDYQPNQIARSLRMKSSKTIGVIVADIANPFFGQLARIIENQATNFGYTMIFGSSDEDAFKSESLVNTFLNRQVDGFIIVPTEGTIGQIRSLVMRKIPFVLLDRYFPEVSASHVSIDNFMATYEATTHLINEGCRNISMFAYKLSLIHMRDRIRGYQEAMQDHKMAECIHLIEIRPDHDKEDMEKAFNLFVLEKSKRNGLLFATNTLSVHGLYCIKKRALRIPEDLSFVGFDGGESFDLYDPPLSYIRQPLEEMGKESFDVLLSIINGSSKVAQVTLSPSLVLRNNEEK